MPCGITVEAVAAMNSKRYSELVLLPTFKERYQYLRLGGTVGDETFGIDRYLNQRFYKSQRWKSVRDRVIIRDNGCDLGIAGRDIRGRILIHHMNPISLADIEHGSDLLLDPEYLICVTHETHQAIHYGDAKLLVTEPIARSRNDTCPWRH